MHRACPSCGLVFEREPGYFVGAMYVSYALAVPVYAGLAGLVALARPAWSFLTVMEAALPPFLALVPFIYRYSRVIWLHFDRTLDPER
jgi:hypothetical protein